MKFLILLIAAVIAGCGADTSGTDIIDTNPNDTFCFERTVDDEVVCFDFSENCKYEPGSMTIICEIENYIAEDSCNGKVCGSDNPSGTCTDCGKYTTCVEELSEDENIIHKCRDACRTRYEMEFDVKEQSCKDYISEYGHCAVCNCHTGGGYWNADHCEYGYKEKELDRCTAYRAEVSKEKVENGTAQQEIQEANERWKSWLMDICGNTQP